MLVAEWAATNPVAFYNLAELACRTPCAFGLTIAALWFKAPDAWALTRQQSQQQQEQEQAQHQRSLRQRRQQAQQPQALLNTWPEYKAYISAVASWCKAHVTLFPDACEAALQGNHGRYIALLEALALMLHGDEADGAGCLGLGQAPGSSSPTLQAVRLVLLLWLTRAALGVINGCLRTAIAADGGSSSSASGCNFAKACEPPEASSSSASTGCYGRACDLPEASSSSASYARACEVPEASSSSSSGCMEIVGDAVEKSMVTLTVPVLHALRQWQKTTSALTRGSTATSSPAAAAAPTDVSCLTTRKRLSRLPLQGLPEAVATQLDKCTTIWRRLQPPSATAAEELMELPLQTVVEGFVEDHMEGRQNLGWEMGVLCKLLLEEVPSPLGCNLPGCSNLSGFTEADEAGSVCTRCQEARYCSRQCQVDHWEQHKKACRRLKKQAEAAAAAAGGRTVEVEGAGRTGGGGGAGKGTKASRKGAAKG